MNTQTHLLLASAVLMRRSANAKSEVATPLRNTAILLGALLPDASLFVMWLIAKSAGIPESVIWEEWYYSERWQSVGAVTNSLPLFLIVVIAAGFAVTRLKLPLAKMLAAALLAGALAALSHIVTDFPLHHGDGHPHFWPLSNWIFISPVSYWNVNHYANWWMPVELLLAAVCVWVLWRRYRAIAIRLVLVLASCSYWMVAGYWWMAFG